MRRVTQDDSRHRMTRAASLLLLRRRIQRVGPRALRWGGAAVGAGLVVALVLTLRNADSAPSAAFGRALLAGTGALGFQVQDILVEGREMTSREAVMAAIGAARGAPILGISPAKAKEQLETLPWIRSAAVERRLPDTLYVRLSERKPLALWQRHGKMVLIDTEGVVVATEKLERYGTLLLVVGDDAPANAQALIDVLATQPELQRRVTAAIRVGGRRWNVKLDNGIEVQLPEQNLPAAWAQLADLDRSNGLLARDIQTVDLRLGDRLVVRVTPDPVRDAPAKPRGKTATKTSL